MLRQILILFFIMITIPTATSCSTGSEDWNIILEYEDIKFFNTEEGGCGNNSLIISGLAMHSMMAVGEITIKFSGESMSVYILMVPAKKGLSGNFSIPVHIPKVVRKIFLGEDKNLIWERKKNGGQATIK